MLAQISGSKSVEKKKEQVFCILEQLGLVSSQYFIKIISSNLRLGILDMTLLEVFSFLLVGDKSYKKQLENAFNVCPDIGKISELVFQENFQILDNLQPELGIPIRPAAAQRTADLQEIIDRLGDCSAEPKIDGLRGQVHKFYDKNGESVVKIFSRNLLDISHMFPEIIFAFQKMPFSNLIVEGEIIAIDEKTGKFLPFQETSTRRRKHDVQDLQEKVPVKIILFDCMLFENDNLLGQPYLDRQKVLKDNFKDKSQDICLSKVQVCRTVEDIADYFDYVLHEGYEGLVLKRNSGIYRAGKRDYNWIKLKQIEKSQLGDTLDCLVLGYYLGRGRRAQFAIGALLVGFFNESTQTYQTLAKVGTGLTDLEWKEIKSRADRLQLKAKPKDLQIHKDLEPDVWIEPELVVEIEADEITKSNVHTAMQNEAGKGIALRFPRLLKFRFDKSKDLALSVDYLLSLSNRK